MKGIFRLTNSSEFKRVRRNGKSYAHPLIVLIALPRNDDGQSRFGVSAGRSVGKAVQRNRAKRLLREALRPLIPDINQGWNIILLSRRPLADAALEDARAALLILLKRARLVKETNEN